ncbi:MAG: esterase family protein [Saprospiraceae bacterium]|nr:esterase family protein [Saprospiraceae bacterium]
MSKSSFRTIEISDPNFEQAGLRFMTIKTPNLLGRGDICLFVPSQAEDHEHLPLYILLHGVYGSAWAWALKGAAHQTFQQLLDEGFVQPAVIAMPSDGLWGDGSAYFTHHQMAFDKWIVEDVPLAIAENIAGTSTVSPLCIGGLSMGGYGALSLGSRFPSHFRAISGHSSITRLAQMAQFVEEPLSAYAEECQTPNVIDSMLANKDQLPAIRFDCGVSDELIHANRSLHQEMTAADIPHHYQEYPGGHEWPYWQEHVRKTFLFFDQQIKKSSSK